MPKQGKWLGGVLVIGLLAAGCSRPVVDTAAQTTSSQPEATILTAEGESTVGDLAVPPRNSDGFADISAEQLAKMLQQKNFTLINVHVPYEGELPDTDLMIPFDQIKNYQAELPAKDAAIVLYCRSGSMSTQAAKNLVALGYTNVFELDGGFNGWQAAGYPLLSK
jgi:rhodanese-related sulfurtransferase